MVHNIFSIFSELLIFMVFTTSNMILIRKRFDTVKTAAILAVSTVVIMLGSIFLYLHMGAMYALTMIPLTWYVPMIICTHILSKSDFVRTAIIWSISLLIYFCLKSLKLFMAQSSMDLLNPELSTSIVLILLSVVTLLFLIKYVRAPLKKYVLKLNVNWLIPELPILFTFALFSYFMSKATEPLMLILLFCTTFSILLVIYKMLNSMEKEMHIKETEDILSLQMEAQRQQYEKIWRKFEMGRNYRHDMRHHLAALDILIQQSESKKAIEYIQNLSGQFSQIEMEAYCENKTVNAVLSFYLEQARASGCTVDTEVKISEKIPFEELDLCIILSNALENAIHSCSELSEEKRRISLQASFVSKGKMVISIENPCARQLTFDAEGFPNTPERDGHGIGLRSIQAVSKKYNGLFSCNLEKGIFYTRVVIFVPQGSKLPAKGLSGGKKAARNALLTVVAVTLFVNLSPQTARALAKIPALGSVIDVVTVERYFRGWGDTLIDIEVPFAKIEVVNSELTAASGRRSEKKDEQKNGAVLTMDSQGGSRCLLPAIPVRDPALYEAVKILNDDMADYIELLKKKFIWYVVRKYEGYVGLDTRYTILCNNEKMLSIRFDTTINVGGSGQYFKCFTLDKRSKKVLALADLFEKNSAYVSVISDEILRQMRIQVDNEDAFYFIPGGIYSEEECFKRIDDEQNFYINDSGKLVIVFDEYQVAPGSMGCPEFVIPTAVVRKVLRDSSLIK